MSWLKSWMMSLEMLVLMCDLLIIRGELFTDFVTGYRYGVERKKNQF